MINIEYQDPINRYHVDDLYYQDLDLKFHQAMSKKAQYFGLEKLFLKGPKAFVYFFLFYLIRDTILYIIIPIGFAAFID